MTKGDIFEQVRNELQVILLKLELHTSNCPCGEGQEFFDDLLVHIHKLAEIVRERRQIHRKPLD